MALHDFICGSCQHVQKDVLMPFDTEKWVNPVHCGKPMDWYPHYELPVHVFEAFDTRNIHPDGKRLHVGSKGDLEFYAREYGVRHVNDPGLEAVGSEIRRKGKGAPSSFVDMGGRR